MTAAVVLPQANANDTAATLVAWLVQPGSQVKRGQQVALFETSKAAVEIDAPDDGWLVAMAKVGEMVEVGMPFARIVAEMPSEPMVNVAAAEGRKITTKARRLMEEHGITDSQLPANLALVRERDVVALLKSDRQGEPGPDLEAVFERADYRQLMELLTALRQQKRQKFARHVPTGTLLHDRWGLASSYGFGAGASVYDECLILGDVSVGQNCWIGPYTILDGSGGELTIGDWTSIGSGAHVYTHHTIENALTGGVAKPFHAPTRIDRCCFIGPLAIIAPGTEIGSHSFIAAGSFVEGHFPPFSYIAGNPARIVGKIRVEGGRAMRLPLDASGQ
ncbi:MAG: hypothetical protein QOK29_1987 [Rhodospirillaceae bacterium]|jgi:acetyltransferase-like isoleucine patch superfamily enzyme|nr:hypothetical protein [Rhodospirillaceae bacterium]